MRTIEAVVVSLPVLVLAYAAASFGIRPDDLGAVAALLVLGAWAACRAVLPPPKPVRRTRSGLPIDLATGLSLTFGTGLVVVAIVATAMGRAVPWTLGAVGLALIVTGAAIDHWRRRPLLPGHRSGAGLAATGDNTVA